MRIAQLTGGVLLMLFAPLTVPLPGPGATLMFAGGLLLVLRNSHAARMRYARIKRRWPRTGAFVDRAMRRRSAIRRRERARSLAGGAAN